jgi:predicted RNA-binding protein YlxR (DUF448 family)/ribosomal protein L30E
MAKEEAKRSCLGCRTVKNKKDLLRFVLTPERVLVPDLMFKLPGRGAYICQDKSCLQEAVVRKQFARTFRGEVYIASMDVLIMQIIYTLEERIASYLALANKAGKVVSGSDMVMQSLKRNPSNRIVLFADDISCDIRQKVIALAEKCGAEYFTLFNKERVGALIGKSLRSVVAVEGHGFVMAIKGELVRYRNFMGEVRNR